MDYIIMWSTKDHVKCVGYYDKDKKELNFFYDQKINKECRRITMRQKLEGLGQTFFSLTKGLEQNMSMKDLLKVKSSRIDLDDAPESIHPTRIETEMKKDPKDKEDCLYVNFYWKVNKEEVVTTMKYRPFHVKVLVERMNTLKISDMSEWVGKQWDLEHEPFGKIGYPHYLPTTEDV